ncbi:polyhydroxyalkanoate granule-associated phasin [Variovorax sp. Sphag1AA]|uniref:polyhydroxyalkanoate granule-associated phasin n=1 Tax=Variovorax sp. Sphag1AA TaxID=2587027 RepID=UPI0016154F2D|nr:polyhydroxyalkanoate granule-associated phasin [Variovorax sp. Sphag1AA]MBB3180387.1 4-hydroxyphenylpyruvate dioxygenase-like putative hemolysin [Variovorax sp. Sphag1AA]
MPTSRFFNPLMLWADVAATANEMFLSSSSVIRMRTERIARAGLAPSDSDVAEFQLMGHEKLAAASEAGAAMVNQLHTTQFALFNRAVKHWLSGGVALFSLATSTSQAQAVTHAEAVGTSAARTAAAMSQLSSAGARIVQRGLKPIHAKATANERRLAAPAAP